MKKVAAIFLSVILIMSLITLPAFAESVSIEVSGVKTKSEAAFIVAMENNGQSPSDVKIYVASYNGDDTLRSAVTYPERVEVGEKRVESYKGDIKNGGYAKIFIWEKGLKPIDEAFHSEACEEVESLSGEKIDIGTENVWASVTYETANPAANAVDGSLDTKFTVKDVSEENPESVTTYLGGDYILTKVGVAFGLGTERKHIFSVDVSEDGENFVTVLPKQTNDSTNSIVYYSVAPVRARFVRISFFGREDNGLWTQFTELEVFGFEDTLGAYLMENAEADSWQISAMDEMTYTDYKPSLGSLLYAENASDGLFIYDNVDRNGIVSGEKLEIKTVTASQTPEAEHPHANSIDGDAATIWTAKNVTDEAPAFLVADLGESYYLTGVGIGFDLGDTRTYSFDVALSSDNRNYTTVITKRTSSQTSALQYFEFAQTEARYVKYTFYKRTDSANNGWVRISEVEALGGSEPIEGAGGVLAQKKLSLPENREDFCLSFDLNLSGNVYYSGVSLTDGYITGGADIDNYAALQLRFDNDGSNFKINYMTSNYFNEGSPVPLFEKSFKKDDAVHFELAVSPVNRTCHITVSDSENSETRLVYFSYADNELTRNTSWTWLEAGTLVFNTGASAKANALVKNISIRHIDREKHTLSGNDPQNGIIRLEAVRLSDYPTSSGDYYGRYVYHSGEDEAMKVAADKNPAVTRFVERRGLLGCGVSFEAVTLPGYFVVMENGAFYLKKLENTGDFYSRATFYKDSAENVGYYTGATYSYRTYLQIDNEDKFLYDTTSDKKTGDLKPWKKWSEAQGVFYLRSEATEYVCDNFYGNSISSQWWTNYPWKNNNPTRDSYNHSGLITKNNVIVENGELFLKATKISGWPEDVSGETGINYNKWGKGWERWKGYVGVVSIQNKVFNKQCYIEGSFKQPESPIGYWNAFWLTGRDSWPPEIDIFETLSSSYGANAWHTAIHGENDTNNLFGKQTSNINITTGYHTFAMDWGYDYIKFYVDGRMFQRAHNNSTLAFQKNLRLILNTGVGGWEAEPDDTMVWDDGMRCRYIRSFLY